MIPRLHIKMATRFRDIFGYNKGEIKLYYAPGRVTISGEHIDYSGGDTITCAIDRGTYIVARKRSDLKVNLFSQTFKSKKNFVIENLKKEAGDEWSIYVKGVIASLLSEGYEINGFDMFIHTEIPFNSSLASSSAFCACLTATILDINGKPDVSWQDKARISYNGEIKFASSRTSISDHATMFISEDKMINQFNLSSMTYVHFPFVIKDYSMAIVNSNKKRISSDTEYNSRKRECESAFKKIKAVNTKLKSLSDVKLKDLDGYLPLLTSKEQRRLTYVVNEVDRVSQTMKAIKKENIKDFSTIMLKTHKDLSTLYEVSTPELDILVEESILIEGVLGARMAGNGFGGGALMFFKDSEVENIIGEVYSKYKERTRHDADIYILKPSSGIKIFNIE